MLLRKRMGMPFECHGYLAGVSNDNIFQKGFVWFHFTKAYPLLPPTVNYFIICLITLLTWHSLRLFLIHPSFTHLISPKTSRTTFIPILRLCEGAAFVFLWSFKLKEVKAHHSNRKTRQSCLVDNKLNFHRLIFFTIDSRVTVKSLEFLLIIFAEDRTAG